MMIRAQTSKPRKTSEHHPEQRRLLRHLASLEGRIGYDGKYRLRCLILNISRDGAKLALKAPFDLPAEFFLTVSRRGEQIQYWARIKWRRGLVLGVTLARAQDAIAPDYGLSRGRAAYKA